MCWPKESCFVFFDSCGFCFESNIDHEEVDEFLWSGRARHVMVEDTQILGFLSICSRHHFWVSKNSRMVRSWKLTI